MEIAPPPPLPPLDLPKFEGSTASGCSTPFLSASSSPSRLSPFFSAPTSPSRQLSHNPSLRDANFSSLSPSHTPFNWEEKPGTPKRRGSRNRAYFLSDENALINDADDDFAFDFSCNLERDAIPAAEDLFYQGKIRPLKPPPGCQLQAHLSESETEQGRNGDFVTACSSPKSPRRNNLFFEKIISSPKRRDYPDPFEIALENSRNLIPKNSRNYYNSGGSDLRGRGKMVDSSTRRGGASSEGKKKTRSLSPFPRVSDVLFGDEGRGKGNGNGEATSFWGGIFPVSKSYRKWKIKDLLFRSASEGRCTDKIADHPALTKYVEIRKQGARSNDVRNSSFRSCDSFSGSVGSSRRVSGRGKVPVSAHELHYTMNRAVYEEMKKKTYLPYKQGLLGCLGFSPPVHDISISRGGSMPRV